MTIQTTIKNFSNNVGNGFKVGEHTTTVINHGRNNGDTTLIMQLMNIAIKKGNTNLANTIKFTTGKIWIGAKFEMKNNLYVKIKTKNCELSNSAVEILDKISGNVSIHAQKWRDAFKTDSEKNTTKEIDFQKRASNFAQKHPELLEQKIAETKAMLAALEAQRATVSKKKLN